MIRICLTLIAALLGIAAIAQSPGKFNYQAIARDAEGIQLANHQIGLQISVLEGSPSGASVFSETHSAITNEFGLFNLFIGTGSNQNGSIDAVNWGADDMYVKIEMDLDGGTSYSISSTTEMVSVPYALYANHVANDSVIDDDADTTNEIQALALSGDMLELTSGGSVDLSPYDESADVAQNATDIADNVSDIADNAADIADNASDIAGHVATDNDLDSTNELITSLSFSNDSLLLTEGGLDHSVSLYDLIDDDDWVRDNDTVYNDQDHIAVGGSASINHALMIRSDSGHAFGIHRSFTTGNQDGLSVGIDLDDYVSSADTIIGIRTNIYQPASGVAISQVNNVEGFGVGGYGTYNRLHYGNDTAMGTVNAVSNINGLSYGTVNAIDSGSNSGYGVFNALTNPGGNGYGIYTSISDGSNQQFGVYNQLDSSLNQATGVHNVINGSGATSYGMHNEINYPVQASYGMRNQMNYGSNWNYGVYNYMYYPSYAYGSYNYIVYPTYYGYASRNNLTANNIYTQYCTQNYVYQYGAGDAYGVINQGYRGSGNDTYAYGEGARNTGYNNNTGSYGYAYGARNQAYAYNGSYNYAYGSYNYAYSGSGSYRYVYGMYASASGGNYNNYAGFFSGPTYTTSGYYSSDVKLKKDVRDFEGGISAIMELEPKRYSFDAESFPTMGLPSEEQIGLIAQDIEEVFPELVKTALNPPLSTTKAHAEERGLEYIVVEEAEFDQDGRMLRDAEVLAGEEVEFKAVNYNGLIPVLVKAIQEQQVLIETLTERVEMLENP